MNRWRGQSPRSKRNIQRWAVRIDVEMFRFGARALRAQRILGGGFGRGAKPPSEWNVQGVRLACGRRAPPCSWNPSHRSRRGFFDKVLVQQAAHKEESDGDHGTVST